MRYTIRLAHRHGWEPRDWAQTHCSSYSSCTVHGSFSDKDNTLIDYHFSDDKDAFWFRMRWE